MNLNDLPPVITVPEYAKFVRIGRNQAYEAIRRGDIYAIRIGRSLRVPRAELERVLHGRGDADAPAA